MINHWSGRALINSLDRNTPVGILKAFKSLVNEDHILANWFAGVSNWGDSISPVIIEHYSKRKPVMSRYIPNIYNSPVYMAVGSLLQTCRDKNIEVWGTGLISKSSIVPVRPKNIWAVRGPRTRDLLLKQGIDCPPTFGDPALLFPEIYKPDTVKRYKLGIIPHYIDKKIPLLDKFKNCREIKMIDVCGDIYGFVNDICECQSIASSSLHGCIAADAYGIPSLWVKMSSNVLGDDFKFLDYYDSIRNKDVKPHYITDDSKIEQLIENCTKKKIDIDLNELKNACPFICR